MFSAYRKRNRKVLSASAASETTRVVNPDSPNVDVDPVCWPACCQSTDQLADSSVDTSTMATWAADDRPRRLAKLRLAAAPPTSVWFSSSV